MDFHVGIPTSVSSVIGSEDAFIEPHAYQSTPLLLFGFGIPLLELSRQDNGESGAGAGRRRGIDDANRGIDDPATQVGQILQCNHGQSGIGQCGRTARAGHARGARCGQRGDALEARRLDVRVGYGFSVFDTRFVSTPEIGVERAQADRELRVGWRLELARSDRMAIEAGIEATRPELAYDETGPEHGLALRLRARW